MESLPATMAKAARAGAMSLRGGGGLPEEIVIWEILVRLPPKALLRCRVVCRAWRRVTSTHDFLLTHHACQPTLSIISGFRRCVAPRYHNIYTFDRQASTDIQVQPVARLDLPFSLETSCEGLLILKSGFHYLCVCNPATRQHVPLMLMGGFSFLGIYLHHSTAEYRLLLYLRSPMEATHGRLFPKGKIGCYISVLGSDEPPRYIGGPDTTSELRFNTSILVRDNLHWYPVQHQSGSKLVCVYNTTTESFSQMHAPVVPTKSYIFEMDDTIGIYSYNYAMKIVDIWELQNYESEVWNYKYRVDLPFAEIGRELGMWNDCWDVSVVSADGDVFLLLSHGGWLLHINTDGELVGSFHRDGEDLYPCELRLKQTLVPHAFFAAVEDNFMTDSPFI